MRRDDVSTFYHQSTVLAQHAMIFFFANIVVVLIAACVSPCELVELFQVLFPFLYLFVSVIDDCHCSYEAGCKRRKALIENAFGINVTEYKTYGYYNNHFSPSLLRFIVDNFESVFFTMRIVKQMLRTEIVKAITAIAVLITCLLFANINFIGVVMEGVLSAHLLYGTVTMIVFYFRVKAIYERLYGLLVSEACLNDSQLTLALAESIEYEVCKAHYKVRVSTKLFKKMNKRLSKEWRAIEAQICKSQEHFYSEYEEM